MAGCSSPANDKTDMYSKLIFDNPDSLLQIVTATDTVGMSIADKHLHNLMYTAAMYRTGMNVNDTTDIRACEDYYIKENDAYHAALSKLCHAENAYHNFDYYKAVAKLMETLKLIDNTDNHAVKYDVYSLLYKINIEAGCMARAEEACHRADEYAIKGGSVNQIAEARNNMASFFIAQNRLDEAKIMIDSNVTVIENADKRRCSEYYRIKGAYLLGKDSITEAYEMLKTAETILPTAETFYDIALMYLKAGEADSCINYCHSVTTADRRGYVSMKAYNIIIKNYSNRMGNNTLIRICSDLNKLYLRRGEIDFSRLERMQTENNDTEDYSYVWLTLIFVLLGLSAAGYIFKKKHDAKKCIDGDKLLMNESIVYDLHKCSTQGRRPSQEQWIALHSAANKHIPFFLEHLHKINDLSARDINICLLTRLHFTPSEIASLTEVSPQSVTNIRARLLGKIFGIKGGAAEFDRRICGRM